MRSDLINNIKNCTLREAASYLNYILELDGSYNIYVGGSNSKINLRIGPIVDIHNLKYLNNCKVCYIPFVFKGYVVEWLPRVNNSF